MRIRHLSIRNFRGIRELDWAIPDLNVVCLVGRGDSTKSTILEAIRRLFHPQWNLAFGDTDFHKCDPDNAINIEAVLGDLPDEFRDLERYGYWLCGWNPENLRRSPEPGDGLEDALRVRLTVSGELEPTWVVLRDDADDGKPFRPGDRARVSVSLVGDTSDRHLSWSRGSILSRLTEAENIASSLAGAARAAKAALEEKRDKELTSFDQIAHKAEKTARSLGVTISGGYKAHLDIDAVNLRMVDLSLHDGDMPVRQLGLGSKRMLTTGLQGQARSGSHITLFDEVEFGLEPHRIARLLKHLKDDESGQYFLTTHSPVVLRELTITELHVVHRVEGYTRVVHTHIPAFEDLIQGRLRSGAEAFLAPNVVVCEGATEVGFLRALDDHWSCSATNDSFAYAGVALFDAGGAANIKKTASALKTLGYQVAILADSDDPEKFSDNHAEDLRTDGVTVAKWSDGLSIEGRVFRDLPWDGVMACFSEARRIVTDDKAVSQVKTQFGSDLDPDWTEWADTQRMRSSLGVAAKVSSWFKRQDWGHQWGSIVAKYLSCPSIADSDLVRQVAVLRNWIDDA